MPPPSLPPRSPKRKQQPLLLVCAERRKVPLQHDGAILDLAEFAQEFPCPAYSNITYKPIFFPLSGGMSIWNYSCPDASYVDRKGGECLWRSQREEPPTLIYVVRLSLYASNLIERGVYSNSYQYCMLTGKCAMWRTTTLQAVCTMGTLPPSLLLYGKRTTGRCSRCGSGDRTRAS